METAIRPVLVRALAALATILMYLVLAGRTQSRGRRGGRSGPEWEQSYRFGFHRLGSVLLVSVLVGLLVIGGLILFIIPGTHRDQAVRGTEALVIEGRGD